MRIAVLGSGQVGQALERTGTWSHALRLLHGEPDAAQAAS